jgi:hypothetical protein
LYFRWTGGATEASVKVIGEARRSIPADGTQLHLKDLGAPLVPGKLFRRVRLAPVDVNGL